MQIWLYKVKKQYLQCKPLFLCYKKGQEIVFLNGCCQIFFETLQDEIVWSTLRHRTTIWCVYGVCVHDLVLKSYFHRLQLMHPALGHNSAAYMSWGKLLDMATEFLKQHS